MSFYNKKDILFLGLPALDWHPLLFLIWAMIISINLFLSHDKSTSTWIENNFPPEYSPTFVDLEFEEDKREWLAATPSTLLVPKTLARASPPRPPGIIGSQCQIGQLQISDGSIGWKLESTSDRRASDPSWLQTWWSMVAFFASVRVTKNTKLMIISDYLINHPPHSCYHLKSVWQNYSPGRRAAWWAGAMSKSCSKWRRWC